MKKVDPVVIKESTYVAVWVFVLSLLTQAVFLLISKWDYTVLLGNALGFLAAAGNFFAMAYTVQLAVDKEEKDAKNTLKLSQTLRVLGMFAVAVVGHLAPCFNLIAVVIPFVFPSIAVFLRPLFKK